MELDVMCTGGDLRDVQTFASAAERAGVHGMVFTEGGRTAYLAASAAGLAASTLALSTGVAVAFARSPMVTAQLAWELADLTVGRFRLGLGTQVRVHAEQRYSAPFDPPGPRLREYVQAVKAAFSAFAGRDPLRFEGEFYAMSFLPPAWSPPKLAVDDPPVDVAAVNPWMWQMAGEVADGVHVHPLHSPSYLDEVALPALTKGTAKAGRTREAMTLIVPVLPIVGDTEEERAGVAKQVRAQLGFYGSTPAYAFQFDRLGFEGLQAELNARLKAGDFGGMQSLLSDEVVEHFTVTATWDELPQALADRYRGRADRLVAYPAEAMWRHDPTTLERWGEVAQRLRDLTPTARPST